MFPGSIKSEFEDDYTAFDDGVELSDVTKNYKEMLGALDAFKEQK